MRVCVYTAIYGGYDTLKAYPTQTMEADFVCFTDQEYNTDTHGWRVICDRRFRKWHPRMQAKYFKVRNHRVFNSGRFFGFNALWHGLTNYDVTIWMDGHLQIKTIRFVEIMASSLGRYGIAMPVHPDRDCIYTEVDASIPMRKYHGLPLREQVESYRRRGYPEHNGLMASGVIVRDMSKPLLASINDDWWREIENWSYQDQLSLPFALWSRNYWYDEVYINIWDNDLYGRSAHASDL